LNKYYIFILLSISSFIYQGCKPDDPKKTTEDCEDLGEGGICGTATPYNFIMPQGFPAVNLPADNPLTEEGILLGRMLFYDPILSLDSTQSCASCHKQENAFTDPRQFSEGITGAVGTRNSMPIFNILWQKTGFFWDGRAPGIRDQVIGPVTNPIEMAHETFCDALDKLRETSRYRNKFCEAFGDDVITEDRYQMALEQFLITLVSADSKSDKIENGQGSFTFDELSGRKIFFGEPPLGGDCFHCHGTIGTFSTFEYTNNGLDTSFTDIGMAEVSGKSYDQGKFKTPSLRNIALTAPYMHDGRFNTLKEVIDFYTDSVQESSPNLDPLMNHNNTGIKLQLNEIQKGQLIKYLETLTDTTFINNPAFSNPF
jgi:cytochrome c peroxidase